jgi:hypothetical protein
VGKDRETKLFFAHVVPRKGGDIEWVAEQVCRDLKKFGIRGDVVFKTDQEPALIDLVNQICALRPESRSCCTHSGVGDSKGNGFAERAVQSIEEMVRVHKLALESRIKTKLPCTHEIMSWLVEHAADVLNRYSVGSDGRTPYQRLKGRKFVGHMLEFGCPIMFRVSGKVAGGIMQERWYPGIWLGKKLHTDEHLCMKEDGLVVRSRAVRENSQEVKLEDYNKLKSTPHDPLGTIKSAIQNQRKPVTLKEHEEDELECKPRRAKITRDIVSKFGPSHGCPKCRAIERGDRGHEAVGHSAKCRERMEEQMMGDPVFRSRVERAEERIIENLARYVEKHDPDRKVEKPAEEVPSATRPPATSPDVATSAGNAYGEAEADAEGDADMGLPQAIVASPSAAPSVPQTTWEELAARIKRGPEPLAAEADRSQRPRLECLDTQGHFPEKTPDIRSGFVSGISTFPEMVETRFLLAFTDSLYSSGICSVGRGFFSHDGATLLTDVEADNTQPRSDDSSACIPLLSVGVMHRRGGTIVKSPEMRCFDCDSLGKRGPDVLWIQKEGVRKLDSVVKNIEHCKNQSKRGKYFVLEFPLCCDAEERQHLQHFVASGCCKKYSHSNGDIITNWDRFGIELCSSVACSADVLEVMLKVHATDKLAALEEELFHVGECGLHEESTLTAPHIPFDLDEQWDELTGKALDLEKVTAGRMKELNKFSERKVYVHVPRKVALANREGKFLKTRWVQTEKGDEVRCRLVAQEFAHGDPREDLFAGTPPLFAARLLVSRTASDMTKSLTLMVLDISCAFLYAGIKRTIYIELPAEDPMSESGEWVGQLEKALYGTRDAPQAWLEELGSTLKEIGFQMSQHFPGLYFHQGLGVMMVTHVDDLLCSGPKENLEWVRAELQRKYEVKGEIMKDGNAELKFLGRTIGRDEHGYYWEEDPKHRKILLEEWGMESCKGVATPVSSEQQDRENACDMPSEEATKYRRGVARLNYLAQDRVDVAFAASVLARSMATPKVGDEVPLKRVLRYLRSHPACRIVFKYQNAPTGIQVLSDSDWAGDKTTRKSTSGIMVQFGAHLLHYASKLQKTVALSSGEAELNAQVLGLTEAMGVSSLCREWKLPSSIACFCDSSAARGIAGRVGVGKMKHLQVKQLWIQEQVALGRATVAWVPRSKNPADCLTHPCTETQMTEHLSLAGVRVRSDALVAASARGGVLEEHTCADLWWSTPFPRVKWADASGC